MLFGPFKTFQKFLQAFSEESACLLHLEKVRWNGTVVSPFDPNSKVYKCAKNRYQCKNTGKYFNAKTGTFMEGSKLSLRTWFQAIYLLSSHKKSVTSIWLAEQLGITQKTAWYVLQRIREGMEQEYFPGKLTGVVMTDETFCGGKNKNRHWDKKVENSQGRSFKDKTPVIGLMQLDGPVRCKVVTDTGGATLKPIVREWVEPGSVLVSDEWGAYTGMSRTYDHQMVDHGRKQYKNDAGFSTNALEGFWSNLKRAIIGVHHWTSRKHLQRYVDEQSFKYNFRTRSPFERLELILQWSLGTRLTYKKLTG